MDSTMERRRPTGVTVIGLLGIIGGILLIMAGIGAMAEAGSLAFEEQSGQVMTAGITFFVVGLLSLVFGIGALKVRPWAWFLGVGLYAANIILSMLYGMMGWQTMASAVTTSIISAVIVFYLLVPDVRASFRGE